MDPRSRFLPEGDLAALAPFVVDRDDGRSLLVALFERGLPLWVFPTVGAEDDYVISQILAVDGARMELEIGPDRRWEAMVREPEVAIVSFLDRVKIQLRGVGRGEIEVDGEQRFGLVRTGEVYRLQRRDGFRLALTGEDLAVCHLREPDGTRRAFPVLDVSVVGVALAFPAHFPRPPLGRRFRGVRLQLPEALLLPCDLVVRHVADGLDPNTGALRVGCAYEPMPSEVARTLQRAIMDLERRYQA